MDVEGLHPILLPGSWCFCLSGEGQAQPFPGCSAFDAPPGTPGDTQAEEPTFSITHFFLKMPSHAPPCSQPTECAPLLCADVSFLKKDFISAGRVVLVFL